MPKNPIICAIDTPEMPKAKRLAASLKDTVGALKLGLEFFVANGPKGVKEIAKDSGLPIFLDLKFHDIPNTVIGAVSSAAGLGCFMMTVHSSGGSDMLRAAAEAAGKFTNKRPLIIGVTVLTSMDSEDLNEIGLNNTVEEQVINLAEIAKNCGLDGIVCSAHEISRIRKQFGQNFKIIVPGIRPASSEFGDQKRVMTPKEAIDAGADYIVIGRPITEAKDPRKAAQDIFSSLS